MKSLIGLTLLVLLLFAISSLPDETDRGRFQPGDRVKTTWFGVYNPDQVGYLRGKPGAIGEILPKFPAWRFRDWKRITPSGATYYRVATNLGIYWYAEEDLEFISREGL